MEDIMGQSIFDVRVDHFKDKWFITGMIPLIHTNTQKNNEKASVNK